MGKRFLTDEQYKSWSSWKAKAKFLTFAGNYHNIACEILFGKFNKQFLHFSIPDNPELNCIVENDPHNNHNGSSFEYGIVWLGHNMFDPNVALWNMETHETILCSKDLNIDGMQMVKRMESAHNA